MIRKLTVNDAQEFCDLIKNMYSNLENLEWFSPMPFDFENVKNMIENSRFHIVGVFDDEGTLCGVSSFDYKCGKLIGKIDFPTGCDTSKLVEIGFTMVHSAHRGKGLMKQMVAYLLSKAKEDGFEWVFSKVHKNNLASSKSFIKNGFEVFSSFAKPVNVEEFKALASKSFFSETGKQNATKTLANVSENAQEIIVDYNILIKHI